MSGRRVVRLGPLMSGRRVLALDPLMSGRRVVAPAPARVAGEAPPEVVARGRLDLDAQAPPLRPAVARGVALPREKLDEAALDEGVEGARHRLTLRVPEADREEV